ncbi:hypothetical protein SZ41_09705, partial [Brachyspira hyodysenteriae]
EEQNKFLEEEKETLNNLKEELSNNIEEKIDEKIEKNNANYNSIMLEQNLKNFKELSDLRKGHKDLEDSILSNNTKYEEVINNINGINDKLESYSEDYKKDINSLNTRLEEVREEQSKFLEEEKENLNNLKEELSNNVDSKIYEKIEKNNANYNSIMLEQNLKNFKELSDLRKGHKDLEDSILSNNTKYDELINQLENKAEENKKDIDSLNNKFEEARVEQNKFLEEEKENFNNLREELSNIVDEKIERSNASYGSLMVEQNLKNFQEISDVKKSCEDLGNSINENNAKYDELIKNIDDKLSSYLEENKKEIDSLNTRLEEIKDEQSKFLEEEKENLNNLKEELSNNIEEKIDEKIEKNNANYNSIMLEQNLKNFKELSGLKKVQKDLEDSILSNNAKYDDLISQLESKIENFNNLKEELLQNDNNNNIFDSKIDEKIEKNNANYNSIMLEQNLKNFKELSDLRKGHKDLENSINENILKYDELISKLESRIENFNNQDESLPHNNNDIDSKIDEKIEKNNANYNSIMLEQNLKNFKELSDLRKHYKDLEDEVNKLANKDYQYNPNNSDFEEFANLINKRLDNQESKTDEFIKAVNNILNKNNIRYEQLFDAVNRRPEINSVTNNSEHVRYVKNKEEICRDTNDSRVAKDIKRLDKKISDVTILSISIFAIIVVIFLAYQLL